MESWLPFQGDLPLQTASLDRLCPKRRFVKQDKDDFTISLCGAGRHSEPVFAALPAQKALTTPN
jgi:hypothetical protein